MTLYADSAYRPRLVYGAATFLFDDGETRIAIFDLSRERTKRTQAYAIPGVPGQVIVGKPLTDGMQISFSVEIAAADLATYVARREALKTALDGGADGKLDFYLRYQDASNYYAFKNCVLFSSTLPDGPHDPLTDDIVPLMQGSITLISEDAEPIIVEDGETQSADADELLIDQVYEGSLALYASQEAVVQNTLGEVKARFAAIVPAIDIVGVLSADGTPFAGTGGVSDPDAQAVHAQSFQIEGGITIQNSLGETMAILSEEAGGFSLKGVVSQTL
ncbi:MAG: hypothetical protein AB1656_05125 [Candidatus Omnitrophota bacterium]